jgi:acyl carrier protein
MTEAFVGLPSTDAPDSIVVSVAAALARVLKRDADTITESTRLFDDLGLDSTSVLELLLELENELGAEFDADTLEQRHFETVGTLAAYVAGHVEG